ncbi:MAG TPA: hypothetical protein VHZ33_34645 [Trebonia sp.]|jgi:hypothetical protein|nr:hypothetical protein [Trebonia sp.]
MSFCAKCGRERSGDVRYCGGCGTEFAAASAEEPESWDQRPDDTRVERQPDATMIDRPGSAGPSRAATPAAAEPDPFAAWFAPDAQAAPRTEPGGQWQAAEPWQAADTVYAGSGQRAPAYQPPSQPAPGYPPPRPPYGAQPGPPPGGRRSSGGRKAAFIVVVVLVMLAAGGGAYALVARSSKTNTAQPPATTPTAVSSGTPTAGSTTSASASPTGGSPTASASASASASATSGVVSVGSSVGSGGAEPAVQTTLTHYFQGINTHNYTEYQSAHNATEQAAESESTFKSGYGSTSDSGMTLVSLESTADGGESATVTFTSHQAAGTGIDGSSCNNWQLTFFLVPQGTDYLIGAPPSGYKPIYSDC